MAIRPNPESKSASPRSGAPKGELEQYGVWVKAEPQDFIEEASAPVARDLDFDISGDTSPVPEESFLSEDEENTGLCYDCVERAVPSSSEHVCNGEMDYELGHKICDDRDDLLCPQHLSLVESCNTCGCTAEFRDGERVCWCDSCQRTGCDYKHHCSGENEYRSDERLCEYRDDPRCPQHSARRNSIVSPRACADCGEKPEDDHFPCFRGDEPLCAHCEEEAYGPRSPEERRERTGRCCQCNCSFELICSSDRKDLCYKCK